MPWFRSLFGSVKAPPPACAPEAAVCVSHDDRIITVRQPDGREEHISWADMARVVIQTTDAGPFTADLFWLLEDKDGHGPTIPMGATGEGELLKDMQRRLEAFDNMMVVEAMGSTEMARFVVWEADGE